MLKAFVKSNREAIIQLARRKASARLAPRATEEELQFGMPLFLDHLVDVLNAKPEGRAASDISAKHGEALLGLGFSIGQVVHDYGSICQAVTQLASELDAPITVDEFRTFNGCLDDATAWAVVEYQRVRDESIARDGAERLGVLAHELRNYLYSAELAFDVIKDGHVGVGGGVATVLQRSLAGLRGLIDRSLAEVRLASAAPPPLRLRIDVPRLIEDLEATGAIEAKARGMRLEVRAVEANLAVTGDRQLLAAALMNLLQNAFKFSRPGGLVTMRTLSTDGRVLIEVEDECGGMPPGKTEELFRRFEQHGDDRTGLGLGLVISRRGVEACGGDLSVRNLPGKGCVFTVSLARD